MPRQMPPLAGTFAEKTEKALRFALAIEVARKSLGARKGKQILDVWKVEYAYELAYLRVFTAWEDFLEQAFLRYLCGYVARHGQESLVTGAYESSLANAKATLYGQRQFLLWHNVNTVVSRAQSFFQGSRHETVLSSMQGRLQHYAAIRHRIAHAHATSDFNRATMVLAGRRFIGARPGKFLRSWVQHSPIPMRWIDQVVLDFRGLAFQIVPV